MIPRVKRKLLQLARENKPEHKNFRLAAGVVFRRRLICWGVNSYKTHPIMTAEGYHSEQIFLHAESQAIVRALRLLAVEELKQSSLYVVRVRQFANRTGFEETLARPCEGCWGLIAQVGFKEVLWTKEKGT